MEAAKTLIRTCVRSFHDPRSVLIIDALLIHSVLHAEELAILLGSQPKEVRKIINPLKTCRLLDTKTRIEAKVGASTSRGIPREYYYIPFHPAIDAIKYRLFRLRRKVEDLYQEDEQKKDWRCPHCKAEYETLEVMDSIREDGFACLRCGHQLLELEQANDTIGGNHEKIRTLNTQLARFDHIMREVDAGETPENDFLDAWSRKKEVPRMAGAGQALREYVAVSNTRRDERGRVADQVDAKALSINLTSGAEIDKVEEAKREARKAELAKQNQLPVWHTSSAIKAGAAAGIKSDADLANGNFKNEDGGDKKPEFSAENELQAYMREMEREQEEEERKRAMEDAESPDADDDEFEDVVSTSVMGTPSSSQHHLPFGLTNGIKREYDSDSGPSSDANTPADNNGGTPASTSEHGRDLKRVKFEQNGDVKPSTSTEMGAGIGDADSDDDEDFEDAM